MRRSEDLSKVAFEGPSGLFNVIPPEIIADKIRSPYRIILTNGARILGFSAAEPNTLRGPESARTWADEMAAWQYLDSAWNDGVLMGTRMSTTRNKGRPKIVITTTPRNVKEMRDLVRETQRPDSGVILSQGATYENVANLSERAVELLEKKFKGTRRGKQELGGFLLQDIPGALWTDEVIERCRLYPSEGTPMPELAEVVVGVDPAVSSEENSNETGIVAMGRGRDGRGYVLADRSEVYTPDGWGREAVTLHDVLDADAVVVEVNQGGDMAAETVRRAARDMFSQGQRPTPEIQVIKVRATRGKYLRAEPISALYSQGRVSHVGEYEVLEGQMTSFSVDFDRKANGSPDRLDALVWAATKVMLKQETDLERVALPDLTRVPLFQIR